MLSGDTFEGDIIIGRKFLERESLTLVYQPDAETQDRVTLFTYLPLCIEEATESKSLEHLLDTHTTDFGLESKKMLKSMVIEVEKQAIVPIDDGDSVRVHTKDPSIYAYAPQRMAHSERLQIREIIDDLLQRGIIQTSVSSYCARIVPVRKRSGKIRLCVDLRPLNQRIENRSIRFRSWRIT